MRKHDSLLRCMVSWLACGLLVLAMPTLAAIKGKVPDFDAVARLEMPVTDMPDLRDVPAGPKRKAAFLSMIVPIIEAENARLATQRNWLLELRERQDKLSSQEKKALITLCQRYKIDCRDGGVSDVLLSRVDTVPLNLVAIQAVEESGWGTSRFARQGNNLFGLRCFRKGCGQGASGQGYQVFGSVQAAVRAYLHNLNTHKAYAPLRARRRQLDDKVDAKALIKALDNYAVRADYQQALLGLLRTNRALINRYRSGDTV